MQAAAEAAAAARRCLRRLQPDRRQTGRGSEKLWVLFFPRVPRCSTNASPTQRWWIQLIMARLARAQIGTFAEPIAAFGAQAPRFVVGTRLRSQGGTQTGCTTPTRTHCHRCARRPVDGHVVPSMGTLSHRWARCPAGMVARVEGTRMPQVAAVHQVGARVRALRRRGLEDVLLRVAGLAHVDDFKVVEVKAERTTFF